MPHDHHNHLSPSGHPFRADNDHPLSYWQTMEIAVRELLIEKGVTTAAEIARQIDAMDNRTPANGAAAVARAVSSRMSASAAGPSAASCRFSTAGPRYNLRLVSFRPDERAHSRTS